MPPGGRFGPGPGYLTEEEFNSIYADNEEVIKLLVSITKTQKYDLAKFLLLMLVMIMILGNLLLCLRVLCSIMLMVLGLLIIV